MDRRPVARPFVCVRCAYRRTVSSESVFVTSLEPTRRFSLAVGVPFGSLAAIDQLSPTVAG
ncbi:hypothetical protein C491_02640 [Natronococcus amylolyticus DSM 10524]|uniref:Uncharacterized protein n=1 Tax=Natronococcus amylolyticus DSM 10524 TaxID=1227497 RepID=L9XEJ3_9EURY|nr:hypothetical protein C491_02640 [Natronococcus amylolyticus DSM 10524]